MTPSLRTTRSPACRELQRSGAEGMATEDAPIEHLVQRPSGNGDFSGEAGLGLPAPRKLDLHGMDLGHTSPHCRNNSAARGYSGEPSKSWSVGASVGLKPTVRFSYLV